MGTGERWCRPGWLIGGLGVGLLAAVVVALGSGAVRIAPSNVVAILLGHAASRQDVADIEFQSLGKTRIGGGLGDYTG